MARRFECSKLNESREVKTRTLRKAKSAARGGSNSNQIRSEEVPHSARDDSLKHRDASRPSSGAIGLVSFSMTLDVIERDNPPYLCYVFLVLEASCRAVAHYGSLPTLTERTAQLKTIRTNAASQPAPFSGTARGSQTAPRAAKAPDGHGS